MSEPWKVIVCESEDCLKEAFAESGKVREGYHIYPDVDTEYMTQFTCPRCGRIETWGITRCKIAESLHKRSNSGNTPKR